VLSCITLGGHGNKEPRSCCCVFDTESQCTATDGAAAAAPAAGQNHHPAHLVDGHYLAGLVEPVGLGAEDLHLRAALGADLCLLGSGGNGALLGAHHHGPAAAAGSCKCHAGTLRGSRMAGD